MRRNMSVAWDTQGKYSTSLFTEEAVRLIHEHPTDKPLFMYVAHLAPHTGNQHEPFQALDEDVALFSHIEDPERRLYAGNAKAEVGSPHDTSVKWVAYHGADGMFRDCRFDRMDFLVFVAERSYIGARQNAINLS